MSKVGGARKGAGRPAGAANRRSSDAVAELMASGLSPIAYLVGLYRDEEAEPKDRAWAANAAAPYVHPRMAPASQRVTIDLPDTSTAEGVRDALAAVVRAVSSGSIAPAEGQSLVAVLEAQRRAIETVDVVARLEALEAMTSQRERRS